MPRARRARRHTDLERYIHFYRADCGTDKQGKRVPFDPSAALARIDKLAFASFARAGGRYYEEDDNVYCCWVDSPKRAQFAVIRRDALPTVEETGSERRSTSLRRLALSRPYMSASLAATSSASTSISMDRAFLGLRAISTPSRRERPQRSCSSRCFGKT